MGRPINKRYFGANNNTIRVFANTGAGVSAGFIISQRSTKRFRVSVDGVVGICTLVTDPEPGVGEMNIGVLDDNGNTQVVQKMYGRTVLLADGSKIGWTFDESTDDGAGEMFNTDYISFIQQPVNMTTTGGGGGFMAVVVTYNEPVSYQWQERQGSGAYADLVNSAVYHNVDSDSLSFNAATEDMDGWTYRCVISDTTLEAPDVVSQTAKLFYGS